MTQDQRTCNAIVRKTAPGVLTLSGKMRAILGFLVDRTWTDPRIAELVTTSDGFVLAVVEGDIGANHFIGSASDLFRNLNGVADAVRLSPAQRAWLLRRAGKAS